ncbi:PilZ domain-containing protein [Geodermatophilus sp. SYSU D00815]
MKGKPGVDHPAERESVDVAAAGRDDFLQSFVDQVGESTLVLTVGEDKDRARVRLEPGELLELVWRGPGGMRVVPAELLRVRPSEHRPTWEVRLTGPATDGQRRAAVRAPSTFPVGLRLADSVVEATGVDLSETGLRCWLALASLPTAAAEPLGDGVTVTAAVTLGPHVVEGEAVVIRGRVGEGERMEVSLRFTDLDERREDVIRRFVFAQLRELRARGIA